MSVGSPSHLALPVLSHMEVKSQKDNFQDPPAKTSAAPSINLLTLSTVSTSSQSSAEKASPSPQKSAKISSSQSAHPSPLIVSQSSISLWDPIPLKSVPTVELKTLSMVTHVLLLVLLEPSLILIKMEVWPVEPALQLLDSSLSEENASRDQQPPPLKLLQLLLKLKLKRKFQLCQPDPNLNLNQNLPCQLLKEYPVNPQCPNLNQSLLCQNPNQNPLCQLNPLNPLNQSQLCQLNQNPLSPPLLKEQPQLNQRWQ